MQQKGIEVVIINQGDEPSFEEELAKDVLEIITVFSARLYGSRSRKNKQLMDNLNKAVMQANRKENIVLRLKAIAIQQQQTPSMDNPEFAIGFTITS